MGVSDDDMHDVRLGWPLRLSVEDAERFAQNLIGLREAARRGPVLDVRKARSMALYVRGELSLAGVPHETNHIADVNGGTGPMEMRMYRVVSQDWLARDMLRASALRQIGGRPIRRMVLNYTVADAPPVRLQGPAEEPAPERDDGQPPPGSDVVASQMKATAEVAKHTYPKQDDTLRYTFLDLQAETDARDNVVIGFRVLGPASRETVPGAVKSLIAETLITLGLNRPSAAPSPPPVFCPDYFFGEAVADVLWHYGVESGVWIPAASLNKGFVIEPDIEYVRPYATLTDQLRYAGGQPQRLRHPDTPKSVREWAAISSANGRDEFWILRPRPRARSGAHSPESRSRARAYALAALAAGRRPSAAVVTTAAQDFRFRGADDVLERHCVLLALFDSFVNPLAHG